jgi:uncharacterized protein (DUF1697 family)
MNTCIALLRGINVGGQKSVKMDDLKKLFEDMGFVEVRTYIQSGNVVFESGKKGDAALAAAIEKKIEAKYGFDVTVILRDAAAIEKILAANPFRKLKLKPEERVYVTLMDKRPGAEALKKLDKYLGPDQEFHLKGAEIFILPKGGYGKTFFNNNFFEKTLGVKATTRNTLTLEKLAAMGKAP